jgi:transposase
MQVSTIGLDLAKSVFHVHGTDAGGAAVVSQRLRRGEVMRFFAKLPPCLVGMEACAGAHFWARELAVFGHTVRLMPASYVKAYVKRGKNDASDAAAICEAVGRPSMRFVAVKTADQQAVLMLHRTRDLLVRQRTMLANALRAHLAEFGIVTDRGRVHLDRLITELEDGTHAAVPELARLALRELIQQLRAAEARIAATEREIVAWHRASAVSRRLATIPGIGPITASALAATMPDARQFRSGRDLAAWIGLVPRQKSSGGKERLGRICKQGDRYLRRLLVIGGTAVLRHDRARRALGGAWLSGLLKRRPARVATVALANRMARIAWALLAHGGTFRARPTGAGAAAGATAR